MFETVVRNGRVLLPTRLAEVDLGIKDGKIAAVAPRGSAMDAAAEIDAAAMLVLPGAIDAHFHCRAPSHPERETFATGTAAAAVGGVTTVLEMPISIPPTANGAVLEDRMALAAGEAVIDIGFYCGCGTLRAEDIASALDAGAFAFKGFLQRVPEGRADEFDGICIGSTEDLVTAFGLLREAGVPCAFHAEEDEVLRGITARLRAEGRREPAVHVESRPRFVEALSVAKLIVLAEAFGVHVHIPHVSAGQTVRLLRDARARGVPITAETCPQYLVFGEEDFDRVGPYAKCNPPLRGPEDQAELWAGLIDGTLDFVATDHSPFVEADKEPGWEDIWSAFPGFPGVEILAGFMIGAALEGKLSLAAASRLISEAPARVFSLPGKGRIAEGADADLILYDDMAATTVNTGALVSRGRESARIWEGFQYPGRVARTIANGRTVTLEGRVVGEPGGGRVLRRAPSTIVT